jgi:predicted TIM-barrel fold metal-dependent hydrolase
MIIDFHTHIFPSFIRNNRHLFFNNEPGFDSIYRKPESRLAGKNELLENMDNEGVAKSVVFGFPWKVADHYKRHNDYVIESVLKNPGRFIGFCSLDPLSPDATAEVERCLEAGLAGVGEIAIYQEDFSRDIINSLKDIMSLCAERDVPILLHANEPVGHNYPGKQPMSLAGLYDLVKTYRSNRIVLAHWGGGIFFYELIKKEVSEALSNVWFDTAASPYLYRPDIYRISGDIIGFDRILFGSDYPLIKPGRYIKEIQSEGLPKESIDKITCKNALKVLKINNQFQAEKYLDI